MKAFLDWSKLMHADKPNTARRYKTSSVALLAYFSRKTLRDIQPDDVNKFIEWRSKQKAKAPALKLRIDPKAKADKPIQPSTINRELACLRALFYYHIKQGVRVENPVKDVKMLPENEDTFYVLSREEEEKYLAECSVPLYDVAVIMLETGMRPDEVYKMERRYLHLDKGYYLNPKGKTKAARRRIELSQRAVELLKERLEEVEGEWIFPSTRLEGEPLTKLNNAHSSALKRANLPHFRIYDLRHTFATRILESGCDPITLMHLLGHRRLDMVLKYAHPSDVHKREAIERFENYRNSHHSEGSINNGRQESQNH
jgi:integrase